jgi:hypothetical protein
MHCDMAGKQTLARGGRAYGCIDTRRWNGFTYELTTAINLVDQTRRCIDVACSQELDDSAVYVGARNCGLSKRWASARNVIAECGVGKTLIAFGSALVRSADGKRELCGLNAAQGVYEVSSFLSNNGVNEKRIAFAIAELGRKGQVTVTKRA